MPTIINIQNADSKAQDIYVLQLQIREATQKLTMPTLGKLRVVGFLLARVVGGGGGDYSD
jgi:hypothetical protein